MTDLAYLTDIGAGRGSDPAVLVDELRWYITDAITNHPRSLQREIGPSEVGHPCARRIGYKLLDRPHTNTTAPVSWLATIGTAVHAWLERVFNGPKTQGRFVVERKLGTGQLAGEDVDGSCDVYDTVTATVIDWKCVGPTALRNYRAHGPGPQYRTQGHLYGRGWVGKGAPVDRVMIVFLPRSGQLKEMYVWHEPYDEQVALDGLQRAEGISLMVGALGPDALPMLPTADAYCHLCPWFVPGSTNPQDACPGDPSRRAQPDSALSLIAP